MKGFHLVRIIITIEFDTRMGELSQCFQEYGFDYWDLNYCDLRHRVINKRGDI